MIALTTCVAAAAIACRPCSDVNADGVTDVNDVTEVIFALGTPDADANCDGTTDVNDIAYVKFRLGGDCVAYTKEDRPDNLVAWYIPNASTGILEDQLGHGPTLGSAGGTFTVTTGPGALTNAATFAGGSTDYQAAFSITTAHNFFLDNTGASGNRHTTGEDISVFVVHRPAAAVLSSGTPTQTLPMAALFTPTNYELRVLSNGNQIANIHNNAAGNTNAQAAYTSWSSSRWYASAFRFNQTNVQSRLYDDNTGLLAQATNAWSGTIETTGAEMDIGRSGGDRYEGEIALVAFYRGYLSDEELLWLVNSGQFRDYENDKVYAAYLRDFPAFSGEGQAAYAQATGNTLRLQFGDSHTQGDNYRSYAGVWSGYEGRTIAGIANSAAALDGNNDGMGLKFDEPTGGSATFIRVNETNIPASRDLFEWFDPSSSVFYGYPGGGAEVIITTGTQITPGSNGELFKFTCRNSLDYDDYPLESVFQGNKVRFRLIVLHHSTYSPTSTDEGFKLQITNGANQVTSSEMHFTQDASTTLTDGLPTSYVSPWLETMDTTADFQFEFLPGGTVGDFTTTHNGKRIAVLGCYVESDQPGLHLCCLRWCALWVNPAARLPP